MKQIYIVGFCVCAVALSAIAQEKKPDGFKNTLSAGLTLTDGNSKTLQANLALLTEGEKEELGSVRAGAEMNYGESTVADKKDTTIDNVLAFANVKKTISPKTFASLDGSLMTDNIAEIDYRAAFGPGLGFYAIKKVKSSLSFEVSPTYIWEKVSGVSDDYLAWRFAERFDCAISESSKVWQSVEYVPKSDDFKNYLITAELGVEAAMNSRLNLRMVLRSKYDSTPGDELERNDLTLISGISVSL